MTYFVRRNTAGKFAVVHMGTCHKVKNRHGQTRNLWVDGIETLEKARQEAARLSANEWDV